LDKAYEKNSRYAEISTKLSILKSSFKDLLAVGNNLVCQDYFDIYEIECLLININKKFNSFQRKLIKLRDFFKKEICTIKFFGKHIFSLSK